MMERLKKIRSPIMIIHFRIIHKLSYNIYLAIIITLYNLSIIVLTSIYSMYNSFLTVYCLVIIPILLQFDYKDVSICKS